ncbi:MAG: flagellar hook-length control protein FliK [Acidobacteriota bacterium]
MNLISFANFNISDNQPSLLPSAEKDGKQEEFSTLLNNIFVALQTANAPTTNFSSGFEQNNVQIQTVSDGGQNFVLGNNQILPQNLFSQNPALPTNTENPTSIKTNVNQNILPAPANSGETVSIPTPQIDSPVSFSPTENLISIPENFQPVPKFATMQNILTENRAEQNSLNIQQIVQPNNQPVNDIQSANIEPPYSSKDFEILSSNNFISFKLPNDDFPSSFSAKKSLNLNPFTDKTIQSKLVNKTNSASIGEAFETNLVENKSTEVNPQIDIPQLPSNLAEKINLTEIKADKPKLINYLNPTETAQKTPTQANALPENQRLNQSPIIISNEPIQPENKIKVADLETSQNFNFSEKTEKEVKPNEIETNLSVNFDKMIENAVKDTKIVETNLKNQTDPTKIAEQINPHLLELAGLVEKNNETEILKMRLNPAELGTVEITLERDKSGVLHAQFKTETEGARQALSNGLEQLRDSLQNAGWDIGQLNITNGSTSTTDNQTRQNHQPKSEWIENFIFNRSSEQPDETENNSPTRLLNLLA